MQLLSSFARRPSVCALRWHAMGKCIRVPQVSILRPGILLDRKATHLQRVMLWILRFGPCVPSAQNESLR